ncbi:MAG0770 family lipoprotein [Mycoplasma sp. 744]|uniref:MAG0770 family lipoprotein n=1 Tax=Mycoplasma sp. 744 TaxID=3108531 RepID=UPI003A598D01
MKKRKLMKFLVSSTLIFSTLIAAKCQSSFYDTNQVLEAQYSQEMHQLVMQYRNNYQEIKDFFNLNNINKNHALTFFETRRKNSKNISSFLVKNLIDNIEISNILKQDNQSKDIGYYENQKWISLKETMHTIIEDLSLNENDFQSNFLAYVDRFEKINKEMYSIIEDAAKGFNNWQVSKFLNLFLNDDNNDWPLFNKTKNKIEERLIFKDHINSFILNLELELENKIFNKQLKNIDYSKLGFLPNSDNTFGHLHAIINLWNEWNSMTFFYYENDIIQTDNNNQIMKINNFVNNFKNLNSKNNSIIIKNIKNQQEFKLSEFIKQLEIILNENPIEIFNNKNEKDIFTNALLIPFENLLKIAKQINLLTKNLD